MTNAPRICLDLNVLVRRQLALRANRSDNVSIRLFDACIEGRCDLIISRPMIDRLTQVFEEKLGYPTGDAYALAESVHIVSRLANLVVVGGGVHPVRDVEDRGVLEAALAGKAHYLATYNLKDFEGVATRDPASGVLHVRDLKILPPGKLVEILEGIQGHTLTEGL